jgi:aldose 1-epimerase
MTTATCSVLGTLPDGRAVHTWRLAAAGISAEVLTLGAALNAVRCPDRDGHLADVVLSPREPADRYDAARYLGAVVGRYANRIAGGRLPTADGPVALRPNENGHTLHGGPDGYDLRLWEASPVGSGTGVELRLLSPDGDQGFPGALEITVRYTLDDSGALTIEYAATTDAPTCVNLTNHAYFNLASGTDDTVLDHELHVAADHYTPVDAELIPLPGAPRPVAGTPFDLTSPRRLGDLVNAPDEQLRLGGGGFDHNWALRPGAAEPRTAAVLRHSGTGRTLECLTTEPGLQVYTGNHFSGSFTDAGTGRPVQRHGGIALETQHFPNSPHRPDYPSPWITPDRPYRSTTVYRFGVS